MGDETLSAMLDEIALTRKMYKFGGEPLRRFKLPANGYRFVPDHRGGEVGLGDAAKFPQALKNGGQEPIGGIAHDGKGRIVPNLGERVREKGGKVRQGQMGEVNSAHLRMVSQFRERAIATVQRPKGAPDACPRAFRNMHENEVMLVVNDHACPLTSLSGAAPRELLATPRASQWHLCDGAVNSPARTMVMEAGSRTG